jgi:hypothetical protein
VSEKTALPDFINRMFRFLWFCWQKWMIRFLKSDCPILVDYAYDSSSFYLLWFSCHVHQVIHVHILNCCTYQMHTYRGSYLGFLEKCAKWHFRPKLNFILYAHIEGELTLYVWIQNAYWIYFLSFNQCLSSITKKGRLKIHLCP